MYETLFNYKIISQLGEGGMSLVYLGEDSKTKQRVAIKELLPQLAHSEDLRNRFRREAQIMAALDHPNIVKLLRYEEDSNGFFLIMEYVEGLNLEQQIQQVTGPISEIKTIEIMSCLLDAFGYAHEKGIIHRDIKPSNIIITREGKVKILDFGIAKIVDDDMGGKTKTGTRMGSVLYMSPEQVNALSDVDLRTDIYSLGIVLFQMITGTAPYDITTESEFAIQTHIVKDSLPIAKNIYPYVPDYIQKIIDKATEKDINNRFQNCGEFKFALINKENVILKDNKNEDVNNPQRQKNNSFQIALGITISIILIFIFVAMASNRSVSVDEQLAAQQADSIRVADSIAAAEAETAAASVNENTENGSFNDDYNNQSTNSQESDNLYFLQNYQGKYPYDVNLLDNSALKNRLINLVGDRYNFIKEMWNVESPMEIKDNMFISEACQQHNCNMTNFIILFDFSKNVLYVGVREEGKVELYSEDGNSCVQLNEWGNNN